MKYEHGLFIILGIYFSSVLLVWGWVVWSNHAANKKKREEIRLLVEREKLKAKWEGDEHDA